MEPAFGCSTGGGGGGGAFRGKRESGKENPYSCVVLGGARSMDERRAALAAFKDGDVRFLIATDVAARGLDIQVGGGGHADAAPLPSRVDRVDSLAGGAPVLASFEALARSQRWGHIFLKGCPLEHPAAPPAA